jgi:murein DD-endopeptidase MepM/ murein hydrolase activator NlpD
LAEARGNLGTGGDEAFTGQKSVEKLTDTGNKGLLNMLKTITSIEKSYDKIQKHAEKTAEAQAAAGGRPTSTMGTSLAQLPDRGGGMSTASRIGLGVAAVGAGAMGIMPNTMTAVTQRLSAEGVAMYSSGRMGARGVINSANTMAGRGNATSSIGPTLAMGQILSQGGYGAQSVSTQRIMNQIGGMSAISGMSNEQAAGSYAGQSGMNMLRLGIRLRDRDGALRPPNEIINELYSKIYRGKTPKNPEVMFSPNSIEYQTIMNIAGGDPNLFNLYASGLMARFKNNKPLTDKQMSSAKGMLGTMGVKGGVQESNFNFQSSQNRLLEGTEQGLVGGYQGALGAAAAVNNGFAAIAEEIPGVVNGLASLKGLLQTLPQAGGAGATMSGAAGALSNMLMMRMALGGGKGLIAPTMGATAAAGTAGAAGATGAAATAAGAAGAASKFGKFAGLAKPVPILGAALSAYGGYQTAKSKKGFDFKSMLSSAALGGGTGALLGAGTGPGALVTGLIGALIGGGSNAVGQLMGQGGGDSSGPSSNSPGTTPMAINPAPKYQRVSSQYGWRSDPNNPKERHHHGGIDYAMPVGSPVLAAADGIVDQVTTQPNSSRSFGHYVVIKHDGFFTYYAHLSKSIVKVGQEVRQGQLIAYSGGKKGAWGSGSSTGPHLHFEVRLSKGSKQSVDPKSIFGKIKSTVSGLFSKKGSRDDISEEDLSQFVLGGNTPQGTKFAGGQLLEAIQRGGPLSYGDLSGHGALDYAKKIAGDSSVLDGLMGDSQMTAASGDEGGMAFGSRKGLLKALYNQGFRGKSLQTAFAVALAESGGRAKAIGDESIANSKYGPSLGIFQIRSLRDPKKFGESGQWRDGKRLFDPSFNVKAAWNISNQGKNWKAWSAYNNGAFSKFLDDAESASKAAGIPSHFYGTDRTKEGLAYLHSDEMVLNKGQADLIRNNKSAINTGGINVQMTVNIAKAGDQEVLVLLDKFKQAVATDKDLSELGRY